MGAPSGGAFWGISGGAFQPDAPPAPITITTLAAPSVEYTAGTPWLKQAFPEVQERKVLQRDFVNLKTVSGGAEIFFTVDADTDEIRGYIMDPMLEIARGNVEGQSSVNKFGRATDVDSTQTDIHDGANATDSVVTYVAPTAARVHQLTSTSTDDDGDPAGTGAQTVQVFGLTDWDTAEANQTLTMDGTSNVATNSYVLIHRMKVTASGASGPNVGVVTATADTDGTVSAQINVGEGQTQMAVYGVPSTQTAYVTGYYVSGLKAVVAASWDIKLLVNPFPDVDETVFLTKHTLGIKSDGTTKMTHDFRPYLAVPGPAIIKIAANASVVNTDVSAGFDIILVDNA